MVFLNARYRTRYYNIHMGIRNDKLSEQAKDVRAAMCVEGVKIGNSFYLGLFNFLKENTYITLYYTRIK